MVTVFSHFLSLSNLLGENKVRQFSMLYRYILS
jgi:hypothetical protein